MRKKVLAVSIAAGLAGLAAAGVALAGGRAAQDATITLRDFRIVQPKLSPGQQRITIRNAGKFDHNYVVVYRSAGASRIAVAPVKPGASKTISVNLKPGAYTVLCSVFNGAHVAQGMVKHFSIGKLDFETGKWGP
jgi:plastocyanin